MNAKSLCPCCSGYLYRECCQPLHQGTLAESALALMRSRYAAYALNLSEYIIATTHPGSPQYSENVFAWKRSILHFSQAYTFKDLEILDFQTNGSVATVTFTAYLFQGEQDATYTERSYFEKLNQRWLYRVGQMAQGRFPSLMTEEKLKVLPLAFYGDAILRQPAAAVEAIGADLHHLVEEMVETMYACNGMGLAAPQVHRSQRVFVIRRPIEKENGQVEMGEVHVFINPQLSEPSVETWKASEGCLSIPIFRAEIERPREITVEYTTLGGDRRRIRCNGWEARVIMHENDHLDGILFVDHMPAQERTLCQEALKRLEERILKSRKI